MYDERTPFTSYQPPPCLECYAPALLPREPQFLLKDFTLDSITVTPQQTTFATGFDYMTDYDEWLNIQVGALQCACKVWGGTSD